MIVNLSLLTNAPKTYSRRSKVSSTISSPRRDIKDEDEQPKRQTKRRVESFSEDSKKKKYKNN
jgi:hypothetical protein